jgi:mannose-6-phosphate isomerase-like protein (cupin superfamily)
VTAEEQSSSIPALIAELGGPWLPVDVASANDTVIRLARLHGEFEWHHHDEDEVFVCWDGEFHIDLEGGRSVPLRSGDVFVVPRGVEHRPVAPSPAHALLIERPETKQYGS